MSLIRPEAAATLRRWRDPAVGGLLIALGLNWGIGSGGALAMIGWALALGGAALIFTGLTRMQFGGGDGGPGMVSIVEGKITYFGPLTGGTADLSEISSLVYDPSGRPAHWILTQPGQPGLAIPVNAEGAEVLFDTFASLPGLSSTKVVQAMRGAEKARAVIWRRGT